MNIQTVIQITGDDVKTIIARAAFFTGLPQQCPRCGAPLKFTYRTVTDKQDSRKSYTYYGLECLAPYPNNHSVSFGENLDKGHPVGLFLAWDAPFLTVAEAKAASEAKKAATANGGNGQYPPQQPQQPYQQQPPPQQNWQAQIPMQQQPVQPYQQPQQPIWPNPAQNAPQGQQQPPSGPPWQPTPPQQQPMVSGTPIDADDPFKT